MRARQSGAAFLSILVAALGLVAAQGSGPAACAAGHHRAAVAVRSSAGTGDQRSFCIGFPAESITGMQALRLTGLEVVTKSYGSLGEYVCKIGGTGTELSDCPAKDGSYWGYWRMTSQGFRHSGIGPSAAMVRCGSVEGWAWLEGGSGPAPDPPVFEQLCASARCAPAPAPPNVQPDSDEAAAPAGAPGDSVRAADDPPQVPRAPGGPGPSPGTAGAGRQDGVSTPGAALGEDAPGSPQAEAAGIPATPGAGPDSLTTQRPETAAAAAQTGYPAIVWVGVAVLISALGAWRVWLWRTSRRRPD